MPRKKVPVERVRGTGAFVDEVIERHPSFGLVGLFKTCGSQPLFGSPLEVNNGYVSLKISHGERIHSGYGYDRYFPCNTVVEIMLSEAQFAQLITSWNSGEGVPCTLDHVTGEGGMMPGWPEDDFVSDTEHVRNEFNDRISDVKKKVDSSINLMNGILEKKGALTKAEKDQIKFGMESLRRLLDDTAPFMAEQFVEVTEKVVQKTVTEIDAFVTKVAMNTGLESLKKMEVAVLKLADGSTPERLSTGVPQLDATFQRGIPDRDPVPVRMEECEKCGRMFPTKGRNPAYEGPALCFDCDGGELRDKGVVE
jgi:hypothetical protein